MPEISMYPQNGTCGAARGTRLCEPRNEQWWRELVNINRCYTGLNECLALVHGFSHFTHYILAILLPY